MNSEAIESAEVGGFKAEVLYDPDPWGCSPREWSNVTIIYNGFRDYDLGETLPYGEPEDRVGWIRGLFAEGAVAVGCARAWDDRMGCEIGGIDWLTYRPRGEVAETMIDDANVFVVIDPLQLAECCGDVSQSRAIEAAESEIQTYREYLAEGDVL